MMQAAALAFRGQAHLADCDDVYGFGPDLLVAPVHTPGLSREIVFPEGRWTHLWTGETVTGPCSRTVEVLLDDIPVYLREGALMPVHLDAALQWGQSLTRGRVAALVVTPPRDPQTARRGGATFVSSPCPGGFELEMTGRAATRYLLIYGAGVAGVTVNGHEMTRLEGGKIEACPPGWFEDGARTVVRLPHGERRAITIQMLGAS